MSEKLEIILPEPIARRLRKKAEERRMTLQDLILQVIVRILEER